MKPLLLFLFLLPCIVSFAQKDFPGYYVTTSKDTVHGVFPRYRQWGNNPREVGFMANGSNTPITLTPENALMFAVEGFDVYETKRTTRLVNIINTNNIDIKAEEARRFSDVMDTVHAFFRVAFLHPRIRLYEFSDNKRINLYLQDDAGQLTELSFKAFVNDQERLVYVRTYQIQLREILQPFLEGHPRLQRKAYTLNYITADIAKYLGNVFGEGETPGKVARRQQLGVGFGGSLNFSDLLPNSDFTQRRFSFSPNVSPVVAISYTVHSKRHLGRFHFTPQLRYARFKNEGVALAQPNGYDNSPVYIGGSYLNLSLLVGYNVVQNQNLAWYASVGPVLIQTFNHYYIWPVMSPDKQDDAPSHINVALQTGILFRETFGLSVGFLSNTGDRRPSEYKMRNSALHVMLEYRIKL